MKKLFTRITFWKTVFCTAIFDGTYFNSFLMITVEIHQIHHIFNCSIQENILEFIKNFSQSLREIQSKNIFLKRLVVVII